MYLKRIVLNGFKSFAERTEFEFGPGMTGVVGPNGCGKSNLLDALRWVLGEQSAKTLRGSKMLDVIFAGSKSRLPANFAEVQLVFDNSVGHLKIDASEVIVERLLYRSGESEYRLNGQTSRLKDVRDLFLDTGVGVDAYSVIEQGKVDALLQSNPEQRREIFEEAAGISRYKVRRTEASRKLDRTQQNLLRLNDLIEELERQLRSVKLAAAKARKYQEYDQRLRELRSSVSLAEFHDLEQARLALSYQFDTLRDVVAARRADLAARDADGADLAQLLQDADGRLRRAEADLASLRTDLTAMAEREVQARRRAEDLDASRLRLATQAHELDAGHAELTQRIGDEERDVAALVEAERSEELRLAHAEASRSAALAAVEEGRQAIERERREIFESARRLAAISNEHANLSAQQRRLVAQRDSLAERRTRIDEHDTSLSASRAAIDAELTQVNQQCDALAAELRECEAREAELRTTLAEIDGACARDRESLAAASSRLAVLEDLDARGEGIDAGARWVLDWRTDGGEDGGVIGLVADLLRIDDPRVALLQPILARFENHPVVRDSHEFLAELRRRGQPPGEIRLLALDRLSTPLATVRYEDAPGFVARAVDWVSCDDSHRTLAERLLGRTIVVDHAERALAMAQGAADGVWFAALDGTIVEAGGAMSVSGGGARAGLISRKAEIRQLHTELAELEHRLLLQARRRNEFEASASDAALRREALLGRVAAAQRRHAEMHTQSLRLADEAARVERERQSLARDALEMDRVLAEIAARSAAVLGEQTLAEESQRSHETAISRLEESLRADESLLGSLSANMTELHVSRGRAAERRAARECSLDDLRQRLSAVERDRTQTLREIGDADRRIDDAKREISETQTRLAQLREELGGRELAVVERRDECDALRRRLSACGATVRLLHGEIEEVETALRECEVSLRECEVKRDSLVVRVREELSLELGELYASYVSAAIDLDAQRAEIDELRGKIQRLGNVNLDAIAELEELTPRYDNLAAQRADVTASIEQLQRLIADLDAECMTRFTSAFEQIRVNFQDLFRKLFGGGKADVLLEDAARPLECGIEIIARPPGKEPQSISLLSGGEKTLATVALLFAIFKSRPSPFAFLDEVDAALDEGNVGRFNSMLGEFLEQSQFIVITHNKRTMQFADVLYGVTMEEPGVSKRVAVRFDERAITPNVA